jgi:CTP:molybdopterin cytidylyltransferase MocA
MHRGHPWLVARRLWPEVFALGPGVTLRELFAAHIAEIHYVAWDSPAILKDLDTPQDYARERPEATGED